MNVLRLIKTESYKRGMLLSVGFNILAKGILFLLTVLIARFFGTNIKTDIWFFVYGSMILLSGFINAIDTAVLIPQSMRIRENEGAAAAAAFLNYFLRIYFIAGIAFVALMFFLGTTVYGWISKFPAADITLYKNYFLLGSLYFFFQVLTNYINTILASLKFFTVPMIISGINSCIVIAGILLLYRQFDVLSVFFGGIAAGFISLLLLIWLLKKNAGWNFLAPSSAVSKKVWSNILFAELGQLATLASSFLPLFLLSGFGSGVISLMNYGKNIADIPNTLITAQLTGVSGIQLNEQAARNDQAGINTSFGDTGKLLLFILIPVSCYLFVFAEPITRLFYQRGNFSATGVGGAAKFLQLLSVTIFSTGINALVTRLFVARQAIRLGFVYQVMLNVLLIAAIWIFTKYYGAYGYPYALILISLLNFLLMYFVCRILSPVINYAILLQYTGTLLFLNIPVAAGLYFAAPYLHTGVLPMLLAGFLVYLIMILLLNRKFQINPAIDRFVRYAQHNLLKRWYIKLCRYLFHKKYLTVMAGPLKGYQWTTGSSYEYIIGNYENPEMLAALHSWLKPGTVFYDLGANIGFHALLANRYISTGKIYSFEPLPANRLLFEQHLALNKRFISNNNISLLPYAISDAEKEMLFSNNTAQKDGNTYVEDSPVFNTAAEKIRAKAFSIDALLQQGYARPDIIKIDVEGAEYDVLKGAVETLRQYKPLILLATHDYHLPGVKQQCIDFLEELGYTLQHTGNYNQQIAGLDDYIAVHPGRDAV